MVKKSVESKPIAVGTGQISKVLERFDKEQLNELLKEVTPIQQGTATRNGVEYKTGTRYSLDEIKPILNLDESEYNLIKDEVNKPRTRKSKDTTTDSNEILALSKELSSKAEKLESLNKDIDKLTGERDALQREVAEILSKLKMK
jgi:Ca2+-dependent lipid-binding protein